MLSSRIFSSSDAATNYYAQGDYYGEESQGKWFGFGAEELNLEGNFSAKTSKQFSDLLKGIMPNGQILSKKTKDGPVHCPGIDLTFSAPKSFSIQMLVLANVDERKKMEEALTKSVENTLRYIENNGYIIARKGHNGEIKEPITKLIFSSFMHTTNRNLEPQAHVHCLLANGAKCEDGKFRSISFDKLLKNQKFFGQIFRNELAIETKKLGFEITPIILSDGSSGFELCKIDQKLIDGFSTRRHEIEELFKLYDVKTKQDREKIVINSRKSKKHVTEQKLTEAWKSLEQKIAQEIEQEKQESISNTSLLKQSAFSKALEFIYNSFSLNRKFNNDNNVEKDYSKQIEAAYTLSLEDLSNLCIEDVNHHKSVFTQEELYKTTLKFSIGNYTISDIVSTHKLQEKDGIIIRRGDLYTSKSLLTQEKQILKFAQKAVGSAKPIIEEQYFAAHFEKFYKKELTKNSSFNLNSQQQEVIKHVLTSKDKIITIVGLPGVGKSTVLNSVREMSDHKINKIIGLTNKDQDFLGLAPTASAAKTLGSAAKVESNTIHSFLGKYQGYLEGRGQNSLKEQRDLFKNSVIFVDEASLIPTHIMHKLTTLQDLFGFRMVLSGDTKQLPAVEAGKPFDQILQIIPPVSMNIIVRQENETHKHAIIEASLGKVENTFKIHKENIQVKEDLSESASSEYLESNKEKRQNTLLIAPTRALRDSINERIRKGLQLERGFQEKEQDFISLRQRDMSIADYQYAPSFKVGDILKFHRKFKNIKKDEYLKIKQVNSFSNTLILEKEDKRQVLFALKKEVNYQSKFEVFRERNLKLQEDLKIVFTKNNREFNLINSETAIIKKLVENHAQLQFENKSVRTLPLEALKHIDYGYCTTVHSSQGKTFDYTTAAINTHSLLNEQKSWLVTLSRHRKDITLFIEDKEQLEKNLISNDGNQMSAIELESLIKSVENTLNANIKDSNKSEPRSYRSIPEYQKYSANEIHDMLSNNLGSLAEKLLPSISSKKIIANKKTIQCGSISIANSGNKKGLWHRFSTGQKGNIFDLIKESQGLNNKKEAIEWSKNYLGLNNKPIVNIASEKSNNIKPLNLDDNNITKLIPVPKNATKFNPEKTFYYILKDKNNYIEAVHEYRNIKNELCGYVIRIKDVKQNKKQTLPVIYAEDKSGKRGWVIKGFDDNRSLYNEQKLTNNNKPILIVEGEKTADFAAKLYPELTVLSWCGGANGYRKSNWSVLKNREVLIWPDNDKAGFEAAKGIKDILESKEVNVKTCKIIDLTQLQGLPEKWDLADSLPKSIKQYQVTGLLLSETKIENDVRIKRTVKDYLRDRISSLQQDFKNIKPNNLNELYVVKYKHEVYLSHEEKFVREKLKLKPILSDSEQTKIISKAKTEAHNNINFESDAKKYAARQLWEEQKIAQTEKNIASNQNIQMDVKTTQMELKF